MEEPQQTLTSAQSAHPITNFQSLSNKPQEGTLELTIKKAKLTGEPLPLFTQSYVRVTCQGQKNRTPNAA